MFLLIERAPVPAGAPLSLSVRQNKGFYEVRSPILHARLRIRESFPGTYCQQLQDGSIAIGYGTPSYQTDDEFLAIRLFPDGKIDIQRDCFATLPVYYSAQGGQFVLSNNYEEVVDRTRPLTLNRNSMLRMLAPDKDSSLTLWDEIHCLRERENLQTSSRGLHVGRPQPRHWRTSSEAAGTDPLSFKQTLENYFERFYETRLARENFAFELSGGLDSSTLPLYLRNAHPEQPFTSIALIHPGQTGREQLAKLALLESRLQQPLLQIPLHPEKHFPLARYIWQDKYRQFSPYSMIYHEANETLAQVLRALNTDVVVTGVGGDDILENITEETGHFALGSNDTSRIHSRLPAFYTDLLVGQWQAARANSTPPPIPLLPASVYMVAMSRYNIYIEHDIWPVSPFAIPSLYTYCQGLPAHIRANKNILRAYHQAKNFPAEIYAARNNENFAPFLKAVFASGLYDETLNHYIEHSRLAKEGLVSPQAIRSLSSNLADPAVDEHVLFHLYSWLVVELNLSPPK